MNSAEISQIIVCKNEEVKGPFSFHQPNMVAAHWKNHAIDPVAYRADCAPNWSYICCEDHADLLSFCLNHPEYSHFTHRHRYSVTIYWKCDDSPSRVRSVGSFDPSRMQEAHKILKDEIGAALAWASGY